MKVNWTVRFKNKTWLASFFAAILTFVYTILGMFDIYPEVTKNDVGEIISAFLMFLSLMGVIVDPTTEGVGDSIRALGYSEPYSDKKEEETEESPEIDEEQEENVDQSESESNG